MTETASIERLNVQDLMAAETLLRQLVEEVTAQKSLLSAGTRSVPVVGELQLLKETRVKFGNPFHNLTRLTRKMFRDCGVPLSPLQERLLKDRYDFYYMTLAVSMMPGRGVQFSRLECRLDFGPKGKDEPVIHCMFPRPEWRPVLEMGHARTHPGLREKMSSKKNEI